MRPHWYRAGPVQTPEQDICTFIEATPNNVDVCHLPRHAPVHLVYELEGVRLGDVYRGHDGKVWEVVALSDQPQATVELVGDGYREQHVIRSSVWRDKWRQGPLREVQ